MPNLTNDAVSTLVGQIYEAAYDPGRWASVLSHVSDTFNAARTCIHAGGYNGFYAYGSYSDPEFETLNDQACLNDPLTFSVRALPAEQAFQRREIQNEKAFRQRPLWNEWLKPREMDESLICTLKKSDGLTLSIDISRSSKMGYFNSNELRLFETLMPHLRRANEIGIALQDKLAVASIYKDLPFGVLIVNTDLQVKYLNEKAERLLSLTDSPLKLRLNKVFLPDRADEKVFVRLVEGCCHQLLDSALAPGGSALLHRKSGDSTASRLIISVSRTPSRIFGLELNGYAVVMLREVNPLPFEGNQQKFQSCFDLSPAEAILASILATGKSLQEAANIQNIKISTARHYLENVFRKTRTHRQGELVALLTSLTLP